MAAALCKEVPGGHAAQIFPHSERHVAANTPCARPARSKDVQGRPDERKDESGRSRTCRAQSLCRQGNPSCPANRQCASTLAGGTGPGCHGLQNGNHAPCWPKTVTKAVNSGRNYADGVSGPAPARISGIQRWFVLWTRSSRSILTGNHSVPAAYEWPFR